MPPGTVCNYLAIMKVPGYRGMVVVLVNIDVTWVKVQGHLNKPFFVLVFEVILLGADGWIVVPRFSIPNETTTPLLLFIM